MADWLMDMQTKPGDHNADDDDDWNGRDDDDCNADKMQC